MRSPNKFVFLDGRSKEEIKPEFAAFASENKGIFRIGAMDCKEFKDLCDKEKLDGLPAIRIYPTFPAPTQDLAIPADKKFEAK